MTRKILGVLVAVLVMQALFVLCLVSASQLLVPRNMPFGVAGPPSPVVTAVTSKYALDLTDYPSQSAATTAISQSKLYGAYVTGSSSDTLIVVPAKSFFGQLYVEPAFLAAAHKLGRPVTVQTVRAGRLPVQPAIRVLGVSESGYYEWRGRAPRRVRCGMRGWPGRSRPCIWPPGGGPWILAGPGRTHLGLGITVGHGAVEMLGDGSRPSR